MHLSNQSNWSNVCTAFNTWKRNMNIAKTKTIPGILDCFMRRICIHPQLILKDNRINCCIQEYHTSINLCLEVKVPAGSSHKHNHTIDIQMKCAVTLWVSWSETSLIPKFKFVASKATCANNHLWSLEAWPRFHRGSNTTRALHYHWLTLREFHLISFSVWSGIEWLPLICVTVITCWGGREVMSQ